MNTNIPYRERYIRKAENYLVKIDIMYVTLKKLIKNL